MESAPKTHSLQTAEADEIADGGKLVFSYTLTVNEADIRKGLASGEVTVANNDLNKNLVTTDKIVDLEGDILTLEMAAPEPEATAVPPIGMNDAATVEEGTGNRIDITFADGSQTSIGVGRPDCDGRN